MFDQGYTPQEGTPRLGAATSRRMIREHMDILQASQEHTNKIISELLSRLESIVVGQEDDAAAEGGDLSKMSPLGLHLDSLVARQDIINGRLGSLIDRLDL